MFQLESHSQETAKEQVEPRRTFESARAAMKKYAMVAKGTGAAVCGARPRQVIGIGNIQRVVQQCLVKPATNVPSILGRSNQGTGLTGQFH
jgi:hypothetical protein